MVNKWVTPTRPPRRLGDQVEVMLASIGVTKERYKEVKQRFGLPPTCNCDERKEWLNRVGEWVAKSLHQ